MCILEKLEVDLNYIEDCVYMAVILSFPIMIQKCLRVKFVCTITGGLRLFC